MNLAVFNNLARRTWFSVRRPTAAFAIVRSRLLPVDSTARRIASWRFGELPRVALVDLFPGIEGVEVNLVNTFDRRTNLSVDIHELVVLASVARFTNARNLLEIGTYDGNTTLNLAANAAPDATLTTIDLPLDWNGNFAIDVPKLKVNVTDRSRVGLQYKGTKYANRIRQVLADSATLDWSTLSPPFDFVFIDGCHHYDYVKRDTENALRVLKPGGVLAWHDYGFIKDVSQLVDEIAERFKVRVILGTRIAMGVVP